jgi:hypothetical protein
MLKHILFFSVFLIAPNLLIAQDLVRGIVVDSANFAPLPNVNIKIKNSFRGTTTDHRGNFSIAATESDTLIFSLVGYGTLEFSLFGYEAGVVRLSEKQTMLAPIVIHDSRVYVNPYSGMFDDQRERLKKKIPFYYSKARKDKVKAANWREQSLQVQTYVDVVIHDPQTKNGLMKKFALTEKEYYDLLTKFNETHYEVMYFLTEAELRSLINKFFEANALR